MDEETIISNLHGVMDKIRALIFDIVHAEDGQSLDPVLDDEDRERRLTELVKAIPQPPLFSVKQWDSIHQGVAPLGRYYDEASEVAIGFLTERGFTFDPDNPDDDPVLAAQTLIEVGFKLGANAYNISG